MKHKLIALLMATAVAVSTVVPASASYRKTESVPVTLSVSNEYKQVDVTVPASLPVQVINGKVITASNAVISNHTENSSVRVSAVSVEDGAFSVGNYDQFSGSKTIALKINGSPTTKSGALTLTDSGFPEIEAGKDLKLTYYAKVSGDTENMSNVEAAHVIFTITAD